MKTVGRFHHSTFDSIHPNFHRIEADYAASYEKILRLLLSDHQPCLYLSDSTFVWRKC